MAVTILNIIPRKFAEATQTAQYTANNVKTVIDKFTVTNTSSTANATISVNLVAKSDTAGTDNLVLTPKVLAPEEVYLCPELVGQLLEDGGFISTLADTASTIVISCTGREIV